MKPETSSGPGLLHSADWTSLRPEFESDRSGEPIGDRIHTFSTIATDLTSSCTPSCSWIWFITSNRFWPAGCHWVRTCASSSWAIY